MTQFADLSQLHGLATVAVHVAATTVHRPGLDGADIETDVQITNTSSKAAAFFLWVDVRRGSGSGVPAAGDNEALPIFRNDNDVTLWPGETVTLRASYRRAALAARRRWSRCRPGTSRSWRPPRRSGAQSANARTPTSAAPHSG
jgi:exo-1,4-beta-D-glucosaminidase